MSCIATIFGNTCCKSYYAVCKTFTPKKTCTSYQYTGFFYLVSFYFFLKSMAQCRKEIVSFIIGNNKRGEVFDLDFAHGFHAQFFEINYLNG